MQGKQIDRKYGNEVCPSGVIERLSAGFIRVTPSSVKLIWTQINLKLSNVLKSLSSTCKDVL